MSHSTISLGLGLGGGKSATSSGSPGGGGTVAWANTLSGLFDDDYVTFTSITLAGAKSVSLWIKAGLWADTPTSQTWNYGMPVSAATSAQYFPLVSTLNNGAQYFYARGDVGPKLISLTAGTFVSGTWYHLVVTSSGSDTKFYVDSVHKGTVAADAGDITLTRMGGSTGTFLDSNMDEVALWDGELSADQVTNIYYGEASGVTPAGSVGSAKTPGDLQTFNAASGTGPLHWWRFGDGDGDVNAAGGTPANTGVIGTIVDQHSVLNGGSGGKNAANTSGSAQPAFSNVLPA